MMSSRFDWIVNGDLGGSDPHCDIDLLSDPIAAVVPTLGSLLPGWVLVIPRIRALSFSALPEESRMAALALAERVGQSLQTFGRNLLIFEHGPYLPQSNVGCGTDQAHLHVLTADCDLVRLALEDDSVDWRSASSKDPWTGIDGASDYYMMMGPQGSFTGYPKQPLSQFFRRKVAAATGQPDRWDYRESPCYEHVEQTVRHFERADSKPKAA